MLIIGMVISQLFQLIAGPLKSEFENAAIFRLTSDPLMFFFYVQPFALGIVLAWAWTKVKALFIEGSALSKGIYFGSIIWLISTLPGMLISYGSFSVSCLMILCWTISGLVELLCLGIFFSKTLKSV
jgi:hypothetical protein